MAIIPAHLLDQNKANPPGVEILGSLSRFRRRNRISSSLVSSSIKCKIRHFHVAVVQKRQRCTKKCEARAKLLFFLPNLLFFDFLVAIASSDRKVPIDRNALTDRTALCLTKSLTEFTFTYLDNL